MASIVELTRRAHAADAAYQDALDAAVVTRGVPLAVMPESVALAMVAKLNADLACSRAWEGARSNSRGRLYRWRQEGRAGERIEPRSWRGAMARWLTLAADCRTGTHRYPCAHRGCVLYVQDARRYAPPLP